MEPAEFRKALNVGGAGEGGSYAAIHLERRHQFRDGEHPGEAVRRHREQRYLYLPILRQFGYDAVRSACETIGGFLLRQHPRDVTMQWMVEKRTGKVLLDHDQNARGKTLASVYSPRAVVEAAVSMPLRWEELGDVCPTDFTILTAPDRLALVGDLWASILDAKQDLKRLLDKVR